MGRLVEGPRDITSKTHSPEINLTTRLSCCLNRNRQSLGDSSSG